MASSKITFFLNGEEKQFDAAQATKMTINDYLRQHTRLTGTKLACGQGGCGACTVALSEEASAGGGGGEPGLVTVNSCLVPFVSVDGKAITTVEGLGKDGKMHPIQERLVQMQGTQCGFCTPGMVMQMYGGTCQNKCVGGEEKDIEDLDLIAGNLCRCTGYRPLNDTVKSFAKNTTVKDNVFGQQVGPFDPSANPSFPEELASRSPTSQCESWVRPGDLKELRSVYSSAKTVVCGHTGWGVFPKLSALRVGADDNRSVVQVDRVAEFKQMSLEHGRLKVGAAVTLTEFTAELARLAAEKPEFKGVAAPLRDHLLLIAGHQVRNRGSVVGNLMMCRNEKFASDAAPCLAALGTTVSTLDNKGAEMDLSQFLTSQGDVIVTSVNVPLKGTFISFRTAQRPRNAYSLANAAFHVTVQDSTVTNPKMVFGALGGHPCVATEAMALVSGKTITDLLGGMGEIVSAVEKQVGLAIDDAAAETGDSSHSAFRKRLVQTFAMRFVQTVAGDDSADLPIHRRGNRNTTTSQTFPPRDSAAHTKLAPVFQPHSKTTAEAQATGDALFVGDETVLQSHMTGVAAYVTIGEACAEFQDFDCSDAKKALGDDFLGILTAKDLSDMGVPLRVEWDRFENLMPAFPPMPPLEYQREVILLPAGEKSGYAGQPVAMVIAKTQRQAELAASLVKLTGTVSHLDEVCVPPNFRKQEPVITKAFDRGDQKKLEQFLNTAQSGSNAEIAFVSTKFTRKSQSHFYMEPQNSYVIPEEDGCFTVYTTTQGTDFPHQIIAHQLGVKQHQITVRYRRLGGGFGGKASRVIPFATACAYAAKFFKRPVRLCLPRDTDTANVGGRPEYEGTINMAVNRQTGKILALQSDWDLNQGSSNDFAHIFSLFYGTSVEGPYTLDHALVNQRVFQSNVPPRTSVRGPGHFAASIFIETAMDAIAQTLKLSGEQVRFANFNKKGFMPKKGLNGGLMPEGALHGNTLDALWAMLLERSNFAQRKQEIEKFNAAHQWRKRGLSINPARYGCLRFPGFSSKVDIFPDGSIQIACSGCELGQGLHTKVAQVACATFGQVLGAKPDLSLIRFTQFSTDVLSVGKLAGGSTTSEAACFAVEDACRKISERLKPFASSAIKKAQQSEGGDGWGELIKLAGEGPPGALLFTLELSALGFYLPSIADMAYETHGAAVADVEVDMLTGETKVLSTHLMFDCGPTLNPAIDLGQIEGAYVMGLGAMLFEGTRFDQETGALLTPNTWDYKIPTAYDIPEKFEVELVDLRAQSKDGGWGVVIGSLSKAMAVSGKPWKPTQGEPMFKSAKAVGEPPLLLSNAVLSAVRSAMHSFGFPAAANLPVPATPEVISGLCWEARKAEASLLSLLNSKATKPEAAGASCVAASS